MIGGYNFHAVYMGIGVLLVECKACNRRAALTKADGLPIWQGNMDEIRSKRLKCRCGCTDVRSYIPSTQDQADFFLTGDPAGTMRQAN
ncbi:MAG: hypothetical protein QOF14_755 [Hyphomicrobiales bacterium]|jgi:hypothetical protein|nr:hypothetical protein [Hyphomicrobiales bacterium]